MKNWNKEFHQILEAVEKKAGLFGCDNQEAHEAWNKMTDWVHGDDDLVIAFADDQAAYDAREYIVVMTMIEALGLCEQPYFKEVYEI